MKRCDPRAFAQCPHNRTCVRIEEAVFPEGSDCDRFNMRVIREPVTNADRIRGMNDGELRDFLDQFDNGDDVMHYCQCKPECITLAENEQEIPHKWCRRCLLRWLKAPADKEAWDEAQEEPMTEVVVSIKPEYCRMIAKERKFVEVRKSRPKVETPFRAYIYCTKGKDILTYETYCGFDLEDHSVDFQANGHVIGEFVCDHVYQFTCGHLIDGIDITAEEIAPLTGLTVEQLQAYETSAEPKENCLYPIGLYGWRITKLKMYDKPRELAELGMEKPPQSWRYVSKVDVDNGPKQRG